VAAKVGDLQRKGYRGANVTIPHKQAVIPYLDQVTDAAQTIGAVNTILFEGDRTLGHNTDAGGFLGALRAAGCEPAGLRAIVLGAGGAARAVVYALVSAGCPVSIYNRTTVRAQALAADLHQVAKTQGAHRPEAIHAHLPELDLGQFDLLINTTSVGMWPETGASPWPEGLPLPPEWIVVDLVYNPRDTRLLAEARAAGATPIGGLGMLVHQGALAFQLWTGHTPPLDIMYAAASSALESMALKGASTDRTST
jgi:shikimate dehydrogenase